MINDINVSKTFAGNTGKPYQISFAELDIRLNYNQMVILHERLGRAIESNNIFQEGESNAV